MPSAASAAHVLPAAFEGGTSEQHRAQLRSHDPTARLAHLPAAASWPQVYLLLLGALSEHEVQAPFEQVERHLPAGTIEREEHEVPRETTAEQLAVVEGEMSEQKAAWSNGRGGGVGAEVGGGVVGAAVGGGCVVGGGVVGLGVCGGGGGGVVVGFAVVVAGGVVVVAGGVGVGGFVVGTGTGVTGGPLEPFGLHLPHDEWQLFGSAAQSSVPAMARSAQVLEPGVPAGATSLQHLPHERSHEPPPTEAQAPAAATAAQEAKPLELGGGASEHIGQAPKVQV